MTPSGKMLRTGLDAGCDQLEELPSYEGGSAGLVHPRPYSAQIPKNKDHYLLRVSGCVSFHAAAALAIILLGGCATSTKLVTRTPDASLMVPCEKPAPLPPKPSGNVIDKALVNTTKLLLDCKAKHDGLVEFENAAPK